MSTNELETLRDQIVQMDKNHIFEFQKLSNKIDLIHQSLESKQQTSERELINLRAHVMENEKELHKLRDDNIRLHQTITTLKIVMAAITFVITAISFGLKYLI